MQCKKNPKMVKFEYLRDSGKMVGIIEGMRPIETSESRNIQENVFG